MATHVEYHPEANGFEQWSHQASNNWVVHRFKRGGYNLERRRLNNGDTIFEITDGSEVLYKGRIEDESFGQDLMRNLGIVP